MSLLDHVLENLADGITVQDRDFDIIYQNRAMQRFFGTHIGEKCYGVYEQRSTVCEGCALRTVLETRQPRTVLRTAFTTDGSTSFWENACSAVVDESGSVIGYAEICRNVSGRVSLEETFKSTNIQLGQLTAQLEVRVAERTADLARANLYLDKIINSIADPLFVKDREYRLVLVNRAMCDLVGRSHEELIGRFESDFFPEGEATRCRVSDERVFETGQEFAYEQTIPAADGGTRTILTKKTRFSDPGGEQRIVGIIRDITERKFLEEQLQQSQRMESVGMLAGGIAHDFNNLLTPIFGAADLLLLDMTDANGIGFLHDIQHAAERLKELTQHLLAFGRKQMLELKRVYLRDIVRNFEPMLRRTLRENVRVLTAVSADTQPVRADAGQIEQVLLNLAINAQDAMPDGGTLTIEVQTVRLDADYSRTHPDTRPGPYVLLAVSDTGSGMDFQTQSRIFEPFFTTKAKGQGTGLGLSMIYGIVTQHGGSITVSSELGKGSTFRIYLPVDNQDEARRETAGPVSRSTPAPPKETILVLEDNEMVRTTACEMLRRLGYRVLAADGPESCTALVSGYEGSIDMLLTDVVLRDSNGPEVYARLRAEGRVKKVLYMSGYASNVLGPHGVLDEGVQFLQKPLTLPALASKVRSTLDSSVPTESPHRAGFPESGGGGS